MRPHRPYQRQPPDLRPVQKKEWPVSKGCAKSLGPRMVPVKPDKRRRHDKMHRKQKPPQPTLPQSADIKNEPFVHDRVSHIGLITPPKAASSENDLQFTL